MKWSKDVRKLLKTSPNSPTRRKLGEKVENIRDVETRNDETIRDVEQNSRDDGCDGRDGHDGHTLAKMAEQVKKLPKTFDLANIREI